MLVLTRTRTRTLPLPLPLTLTLTLPLPLTLTLNLTLTLALTLTLTLPLTLPLTVPQAVLLRWYAQECPGSSKCKTLFMVGEDAGSCLRIISNEVMGRSGEMWGDMGGYREPRACGPSPAYTLTVTRATGTTARCSGTCCSRTCAPSWCTTASAA